MAKIKFLNILAAFLLCQMFSKAMAQQCEGKDSVARKRLKGFTFKKVKVKSPLECLQTCNANGGCYSFNYVILEDICELNNYTKEARLEDLEADPQRYYFQAKRPPAGIAECTNPCSCKLGNTGDGKTCEAPLVTATVSCNTAGSRLRRLSNTTGVIQTYDGSSYRTNTDCRWSLTSNALLQLQFATFKTYETADYLTVYDGDSLSAPLIGTFSRNSVPPLITSSSNKLYVRFKTDSSGSTYGFKAHYRGIATGSIRLSGNSLSAGRVEIFYDNQWGTICDEGWEMNDANVVCRQLGFPRASGAFRGAHHGQGTGPIWMNGLACSGSESHLYDCRHRGWGYHDCTHSRDASVECVPVRLVNGGAHYGRVEVFYKGIWGTVCDDQWGTPDGGVVCRQLGFPDVSSTSCCAKYGRGSDPIWLDNGLNCGGGEASLQTCSNYGWGNVGCSHSEDAGVVCKT